MEDLKLAYETVSNNLVYCLAMLVLAVIGAVGIYSIATTEAQWHTFDTPAGEVHCRGTSANIDHYDVGVECVTMTP